MATSGGGKGQAPKQSMTRTASKRYVIRAAPGNPVITTASKSQLTQDTTSTTTTVPSGQHRKRPRKLRINSVTSGSSACSVSSSTSMTTLTSTASSNNASNAPLKSAVVAKSAASKNEIPPEAMVVPQSNNVPAVVTGGLLGGAACAALIMAVGMWFDYTGVQAAVSLARNASLHVDKLTDDALANFRSGTHDLGEALDTLKRTAIIYMRAVKEGVAQVQQVFRELNQMRKTKSAVVARALATAYNELREAGERKASVKEMREVVSKQVAMLKELVSTAADDLVAGKAFIGYPTVQRTIQMRQQQLPVPTADVVARLKGTVATS